MAGMSFSAEPTQVTPPGVPVGDRAPDFRLRDQNGVDRTLKEFLKTGKVAIVFHRSVRW